MASQGRHDTQHFAQLAMPQHALLSLLQRPITPPPRKVPKQSPDSNLTNLTPDDLGTLRRKVELANLRDQYLDSIGFVFPEHLREPKPATNIECFPSEILQQIAAPIVDEICDKFQGRPMNRVMRAVLKAFGFSAVFARAAMEEIPRYQRMRMNADEFYITSVDGKNLRMQQSHDGPAYIFPNFRKWRDVTLVVPLGWSEETDRPSVVTNLLDTLPGIMDLLSGTRVLELSMEWSVPFNSAQGGSDVEDETTLSLVNDLMGLLRTFHALPIARKNLSVWFIHRCLEELICELPFDDEDLCSIFKSLATEELTPYDGTVDQALRVALLAWKPSDAESVASDRQT